MKLTDTFILLKIGKEQRKLSYLVFEVAKNGHSCSSLLGVQKKIVFLVIWKF